MMIELPAIQAIGMLPKAVACQMQGLRRRQALVACRKPLRRFLDGPERAGFAFADAIELVDPSRYLLMDRRPPGARQEDAIQYAKARHLRRIGSCVGQRDHPAHGVTDKGWILQA